MGIYSGFFSRKMRSVIRGDDVQAIVIQGLQQGLTVLFGFDGRIPLDEVSLGLIRLFIEPKMVNAYLPVFVFLGTRTLIQ